MSNKCFNFSRAIVIVSILLLSTACLNLQKEPTLATEEDTFFAPNVAVQPISEILPQLRHFRVVLVGEQHDRLDHHNAQLKVIKHLFADNPQIAIGLEFFQQPYQQALDDYVELRIDENEMLTRTEYFSRWRYDYRLYAPILRFARNNSIPLVALNIPGEVARQVARSGIQSLSPEQHKYVPKNIDRKVEGYNERIMQSLQMHDDAYKPDPDNFIDAQLMWDEGMAQRASQYLQDNPTRKMVILTGVGHIIYRNGIPLRLERRIGMPVATVINLSEIEDAEPAMADYFIKSDKELLPIKGRLGIMMDSDENRVFVASFSDISSAQKAGIQVNDTLYSIEGKVITHFADVGLEMWRKVPGDTIELGVNRMDGGKLISFKMHITLE